MVGTKLASLKKKRNRQNLANLLTCQLATVKKRVLIAINMLSHFNKGIYFKKIINMQYVRHQSYRGHFFKKV